MPQDIPSEPSETKSQLKPRLINGHYRDPNDLPGITKLSLKPRSYHPRRASSKAKKLAAAMGVVETMKALPGSCLPGRAPNPLNPPQYTERPNEDVIQYPLAGSGVSVHKDVDPILQTRELAEPSPPAQGQARPTRKAGRQVASAETAHAQIAVAEKMFQQKKEEKDNDIGKGTGAQFPKFKEHAITAGPVVPYTPPPPQQRQRTFIVAEKPNLTDVKALARVYTQEAIEVLVEIMHDKDAHANARVTAAENILNRGWGKPEMQVQATIKKSMDQFTDEEILAILTSANITLDASEFTEAEAEPVGPSRSPEGAAEQPAEGS